MPLIPPQTDPEWEALSDEQLDRLNGQRADSERTARQASRELNAKMEQLNGTWVDPRIRLAVNLFDLDRVSPEVRAMLVSSKLEPKPIRMDADRMEETALAFSCSLLEAALVCNRLRVYDREAGDKPTRIYIFRRTWSKLSGEAALTVVEDGEVTLNPSMFRVEVEAAEAVPLPTKKLNERKR